MQSSFEMSGRMQTMAEIFGNRSATLEKLVTERLDAQGHRVGQAIQETNTKTNESLSKLQELAAWCRLHLALNTEKDDEGNDA